MNKHQYIGQRIGDPYAAFIIGVGVAPTRDVQFLQEGVSVRLSRLPVAMWNCGGLGMLGFTNQPQPQLGRGH